MNERSVFRKTFSQFKKGIMDSNGKVIVPLIYDGIEGDKSCIFKVTNQNKSGVINIKNEIIIPIEYKNVEILSAIILVTKSTLHFNEKGYFEREDSEQAIFDFKGKLLIPFRQVSYYEGPNGVLIAHNLQDNVSIQIDKNGNKIIN